jgi:hypothetical protein
MWVIYSYNKYSKGARALSLALDIPLVTRVLPYHKVINWGSSDEEYSAIKILNKPSAVRMAVNKLNTLTTLKNNKVPTIDFTTNRNEAVEWVGGGALVYARGLVESSCGDGISLIKQGVEMPYCKLYTKGILDPKEYRVHVFKNKIIDVSLKLRPNGTAPNPYIRNHDNGWIFARSGIDIPKSIEIFSRLAVRNLGLDFGAVDIMHKDGYSRVLEVNTAIGIEGTTLQNYIKAFKEVLKE